MKFSIALANKKAIYTASGLRPSYECLSWPLVANFILNSNIIMDMNPTRRACYTVPYQPHRSIKKR